MKDFKNEVHPSYGQMEISRVSSSHGVPLYGASSRFREYIKLTISTSEYCRSLHHSWHFPKDTIIEVEMSPAQFAEAITSLNNGSGTPVTLKRTINDWKIPEPPFIDQRDVFSKEFDEDVLKIFKTADDMVQKATDLLSKKTVSKTDLKSIISDLSSIKQDIRSNVPFLTKCFNEHVDKTLSSAKIEIEAFIDHKIHSAGIEALKSGVPQSGLLENKL